MTKQANSDIAGLKARTIAVEVLIRVINKNAYAKEALSKTFENKSLSERDRAFATALVHGVIRNQSMLDQIISKASKQPFNNMPPALQNILRIGIFQINFMPDMPISAVVNTSVELAKKFGHTGWAKLVNGLLRNYARNKESLNKEDLNKEDLNKKDLDHTDLHINESTNVIELSERFTMPSWLVSKWLDRWGPQETLLLLEDCQKVPPLVVRVCQSAITTEGLMQIFENKGIQFERGHLVQSCLVITNRQTCKGPIEKLPGFTDGLFTVQDEAASLVSLVVNPKPGQLIIDLCAAPGGKSLHMSELMDNKGRVIAVDSNIARINILKKNRQRLGITNVEVVVSDGRSFTSEVKVDGILIDAPCSGTGVINRRSDLRRHRHAPDLVQLVKLQKDLLDNASSLLKPSGTLVYSTCSIEKEENEDTINWFLNTHPDFHCDSLAPYISESLISQWKTNPLNRDIDLDSGMLQLMPSRHKQSGFFICRLKRNS